MIVVAFPHFLVSSRTLTSCCSMLMVPQTHRSLGSPHVAQTSAIIQFKYSCTVVWISFFTVFKSYLRRWLNPVRKRTTRLLTIRVCQFNVQTNLKPPVAQVLKAQIVICASIYGRRFIDHHVSRSDSRSGASGNHCRYATNSPSLGATRALLNTICCWLHSHSSRRESIQSIASLSASVQRGFEGSAGS